SSSVARSFVDHSLALAADADLAAIAENLVADARLHATLRAHQLHVRGVQRRFALHDPALDVAAGIRLGVALDHVHAFDDQAVLVRDHFQDAALLAAILAADHQHVVVLPKRCCDSWHISTASRPRNPRSTHSTCALRARALGGQRTSGASEIIFMNRRSRSSRATGPNTRVPIGSPSSLISTAALRSKRM